MEDAKVNGKSDNLNATMREMIEVIEHSISKDRDCCSHASRLSHLVVLALCGTMGGTIFYLPKASEMKRRLRKEAIYRDYLAGVKVSQLVSKYRVSSPTLYAIIKELRLESRI